jgi:hypothetical protein
MNTFYPIKKDTLILASEISSEINSSLSRLAEKYNNLLKNDENYLRKCTEWQDGFISHYLFLKDLVLISLERSNLDSFISFSSKY